MKPEAAKPQYLFVYGLLLSGESGFAEFDLARHLRLVGGDRVGGTLYDLGEYPGALLGEGGIVHGQLYEILDAAVLGQLDGFEGYDPANARSEYIRRLVTTQQSGTQAWIYEYNWPVAGKPRIASGRWTER